MRLKDRVAVTTGSGGPMGRAIAAKLVAEGAKVVVNDISGNRLNQALELLRQQGGEVLGVRGNVVIRAEAEEVIGAALQHFGCVDILVNVVGGIRGSLHTPLLSIPEADWDFVMALNLRGGLNCTQLTAPHMLARQYGKIVNISSVVAPQGAPGQAHYSAAKAGVIAFTKTAARELAPHVNVNCILPGLIQTSVMERFDEDEVRKFGEAIPLRRLGRAEDVANAVAFLASDEASYITGHALFVSGGLEYSP
jgi:NAD(P)-dependent dehydrogenase (short-subunit alcohol dehydrogenase family)